MADRDQRIEERDQALVRTLCEAARSIRVRIEDWTQEELKDLLMELELIELQFSGLLKEEASKHIESVRFIDSTRLPEVIRHVKQREVDIEQGAYTDVFDAMSWLEDGLARMAILAQQVHLVRKLERKLNEAFSESEQIDNQPEDDWRDDG